MAAKTKKAKTEKKKRPNIKVLGRYPATGIIFYMAQVFSASVDQIRGAFGKFGLKVSDNTIKSYRGYWGGKPLPKVSQEDKAKLKNALPPATVKEKKVVKPAAKKVSKPAPKAVKAAPKKVIPVKVEPKRITPPAPKPVAVAKKIN